MSKRLKALTTKEKILSTSLQLFNEKGERSVSTNHIAAALGISPGNLYYHFRNKAEIISALMSEYRQQMVVQLSLPEGRAVEPKDKLRYFNILTKLLWNYRFLQRDIHHLIELNTDIGQMYSNYSKQILQQGKIIYQGFIDAGLMNITPDEIEALIINLWIILTNMLNFLHMSGQVSDDVNIESLWTWQVMRQLSFLEKPYLVGSSMETYAEILQQLDPTQKQI